MNFFRLIRLEEAKFTAKKERQVRRGGGMV